MLQSSRHDSQLIYDLSSIGNGWPKPIVLICVQNGHTASPPVIIPALLDSGADCTHIPRCYAERMGHTIEKGECVEMGGIGGIAKTHRHQVTVRLVRPGVTAGGTITGEDIVPGECSISACVSEHPKDFALLGCHDFLKNWDFTLKMAQKAFYLVPSDAAHCRRLKAWLRGKAAKR